MNMTELGTATGSEVERITKAMKENLRELIAEMEELLKATASQTGEQIAAVRAKAEESVRAAKARLAEQEAAVMAKTREAAKAADDYVRTHHWQAVGIAAAAGFVLCILATRLGLLEAGEKVIIQGGRSIQGVGERVQRYFK